MIYMCDIEKGPDYVELSAALHAALARHITNRFVEFILQLDNVNYVSHHKAEISSLAVSDDKTKLNAITIRGKIQIFPSAGEWVQFSAEYDLGMGTGKLYTESELEPCEVKT